MSGHVHSAPASAPASTRPDLRGYASSSLGYALFATRWLQAPLYFGLVAAQGVYVYKFFYGLWHLVQHVVSGQANETHVMLAVLKLVDVVMIANLLIMVIVGGYETFVSRIGLQGHRDQPEWLSHVNSNVLKVKLATAIVGISSVHLLQMFVDVDHTSQHSLLWGTVIHMAFILSAVLLAYMSGPMDRHGHGGGHGGGGHDPAPPKGGHGEEADPPKTAELPEQPLESGTAAPRRRAQVTALVPGRSGGLRETIPAQGPGGGHRETPHAGQREAREAGQTRDAAGAEARIRAAGFPARKTLEEFDDDHQRFLDWETITRLGSADFVAERGNAVFFGPPGTGKTHLAIALGVRACRAGHEVAFATAAEWVARLADARAEGRLDQELARLDRYGLLIVDEIGYTPFDATETGLLFRLVSHRYERASVIVTSDKPFPRWPEVFGGAPATAALIDRLAHHADVITLNGDSYRLRAVQGLDRVVLASAESR
ncbi:IS21-like element helper ATPase IstB [Streptomyces sp. NPDC057638]|uniref:IS21-like element helper ATPase IstB n=1 Tax=Streptomyces sp. NPDC057638 TaxID=3346190 RepID=UPI00369802CD